MTSGISAIQNYVWVSIHNIYPALCIMRVGHTLWDGVLIHVRIKTVSVLDFMLHLNSTLQTGKLWPLKQTSAVYVCRLHNLTVVRQTGGRGEGIEEGEREEEGGERNRRKRRGGGGRGEGERCHCACTYTSCIEGCLIPVPSSDPDTRNELSGLKEVQ